MTAISAKRATSGWSHVARTLRARIALLASAVLLALTGCTPPKTSPTPSAVTADELASKTVALVRQRLSGSFAAYCTGVWVSERVILTAKHCLPEEEQDEPTGIGPVLRRAAVLAYVAKDDVLLSDTTEAIRPRVRQATVLFADESHDLALLETKGQTPAHGVAVPSEHELVVGQTVMTMGHPYGLWWSFSKGQVASVRTMDLEPTAVYVQTTAPTSVGNSGGGLWDESGRLVGIAHAGIPAGSNLAFYVGAVHVRALLSEYVK